MLQALIQGRKHPLQKKATFGFLPKKAIRRETGRAPLR